MIDLNNITLRIGSRVLLENASAHLSDGWKVGLIGANGCGKSTLFRLLKKELETESGDVIFPESYKRVFVEQEILPQELEQNILDYVLNKDKECVELQEKLKTVSEHETAEIYERLNLLGASSAPSRAAEILHGLGFKEEDLSRKVKEFSGGWQMRLSLAAALFLYSDVLLLDEPTNHLDLEASLWLENHLQKYKGTLILISHDKNILNTLCDHILHFDHQKLRLYGGNYDTFVTTRNLQQEMQLKQAEKQEQKRKHLQSFVDRFRYKASKAKQAQSRIKMLEKLEQVDVLEDEASSRFVFPEPEELAPPFLTIEDGVVGYDGKAVLKKLNLQIVNNDRIALLGANGNGKSTLAKLLAQRLPLMEGKEHRSKKLKVGYFAQHQTEELPLDMNALEYMSSLMPEATETKVRSHLAAFGLVQEKALTKISLLSGGEKARLLFAVISKDAPSLLILDEPTNHLDIAGREALVQAINDYKGSVILITHDFYLLELIADDLWLVKNHNCKPYNGDLNDYRAELLKTTQPPEVKKEPEKAQKSGGEQWKRQKEQAARLRKIEKDIEKLSQHKVDLENSFQEQLSVEELIQKQKELSDLEAQISQLEEEWLTLSEE